MAAGLPVIANNVGGLREVVDETSGFLVETTDTSSLAKLIQKIFEKNVKTIYIALDDDAKKDAYNMSEFFKDFGIDSKVVKLPKDQDPNDLGWKKITTLINSTESASFSDSIQAKLYG